MQFINESAARNLIATSLLAIVSFVGCAHFTFTPSVFPNPVDVNISDLPKPLQEEIRRRYPDEQYRRIQFSPEAHQYGVETSSGTFLYDATGRELGVLY